MIKYLIDRGIKDIEGMIVTHFDNDHAGGAEDIMRNLRVKKVYINTYNAGTATAKHLYDTAKELSIPDVIPNNGEVIYSEPELTMTSYMSGLTDSDNENSIITMLKYKNFEMLFMGDAGVNAFNRISSKLPPDIEVLKVGHHGARGVVNSEMMNKLNSEVSIVSTGPNPFGHPARGTLDVLRNTDIYRTDRNHSIKIVSDGNEYKTLTFDNISKKYILQKKYSVRTTSKTR